MELQDRCSKLEKDEFLPSRAVSYFSPPLKSWSFFLSTISLSFSSILDFNLTFLSLHWWLFPFGIEILHPNIKKDKDQDVDSCDLAYQMTSYINPSSSKKYAEAPRQRMTPASRCWLRLQDALANHRCQWQATTKEKKSK